MINLDSILKSRDITLPTKVHLVKAMVFPVVMYGCESWTMKKAECQELMLLNCGVGEDSWESLEVQGDPTVHPKGNQSWVFNGKTDVEAETPILWPPDGKSWLTWKDPDAGNDWGQEEKGMTEDEMTSPTQWTMSLNKFWEIVKDREAWHALVHRVAKSQTRLSDWTGLKWYMHIHLSHEIIQ